MKLVSIIVPIYKSEKYLSICIESIINQTYRNLEVLLINDGSPDNCNKICENYAKIDKRIRFVSKNNEGVSKTRNLGLKLANGEFIYFVDSDDWLETNAIELMVNNIESYDMCIGNFVSINKNKRVHNDQVTLINKEDIYKSILNLDKRDKTPCYGYLWNKLFIRKIIIDNQIYFNENYSMWEDMLFCCEYIKYVNKGKKINKIVYHYNNINDYSITNNMTDKKFKEWEKAGEKIKKIISVECNEILNDFENILSNIYMTHIIFLYKTNKVDNCQINKYKNKIKCNGLRKKYQILFYFLYHNIFIFKKILKIID